MAQQKDALRAVAGQLNGLGNVVYTARTDRRKPNHIYVTFVNIQREVYASRLRYAGTLAVRRYSTSNKDDEELADKLDAVESRLEAMDGEYKINPVGVGFNYFDMEFDVRAGEIQVELYWDVVR